MVLHVLPHFSSVFLKPISLWMLFFQFSSQFSVANLNKYCYTFTIHLSFLKYIFGSESVRRHFSFHQFSLFTCWWVKIQYCVFKSWLNICIYGHWYFSCKFLYLQFLNIVFCKNYFKKTMVMFLHWVSNGDLISHMTDWWTVYKATGNNLRHPDRGNMNRL